MLIDDRALRHASGEAGGAAGALETARMRLEAELGGNEFWTALKLLETREAAGQLREDADVAGLRAELTRGLAAVPQFMAWQFVDAALACLQTTEGVGDAAGAPGWSSSDHASLAASNSPDVEPISTPLIPVLGTEVSGVEPGDVDASQGRGLAHRIPTLLALEPRGQAKRAASTPARSRDGMRAGLESPEHTQFAPAASNVLEADVQIVSRKPAAPLLDAHLPPLPLVRPPQRAGEPLPRSSRASSVKWAEAREGDGNDYRPIGSALDEAQVSIIDRGAQSDAEARESRRALGVAPDREPEMRRFLAALSGE